MLIFNVFYVFFTIWECLLSCVSLFRQHTDLFLNGTFFQWHLFFPIAKNRISLWNWTNSQHFPGFNEKITADFMIFSWSFHKISEWSQSTSRHLKLRNSRNFPIHLSWVCDCSFARYVSKLILREIVPFDNCSVTFSRRFVSTDWGIKINYTFLFCFCITYLIKSRCSPSIVAIKFWTWLNLAWAYSFSDPFWNRSWKIK